jgi:hypothetical protein
MTRDEPMELSFGTVYLVEDMTEEEILELKQMDLFEGEDDIKKTGK